MPPVNSRAVELWAVAQVVGNAYQVATNWLLTNDLQSGTIGRNNRIPQMTVIWTSMHRGGVQRAATW